MQNSTSHKTALKLPKDMLEDSRHDKIVSLLTTDTKTLWSKGTNEVATLPLSPALVTELQRAIDLNFASPGIEHGEKVLIKEQKGLDALAKKTPQSPQAHRISRVLFMANDGSERFYRECDGLLTRYKQRLLGCKLDISGDELGKILLGGPKTVRAVLIFDKKSAANVLLSLSEKD